jgi:hypothetical protein
MFRITNPNERRRPQVIQLLKYPTSRCLNARYDYFLINKFNCRTFVLYFKV